MKRFVSMLEHEVSDLADLVALALRLKAGRAAGPPTAAGGSAGASPAPGSSIRDNVLVMVFFNPSLRTRTSFEAAMLRFGGHAIALSVGGDAWKLEHRDGVVMDGDAAEHVREAAPVLSRYGDALAVRTFAQLRDAEEDARDEVIRAFSRHATVPVINMESAAEHPCQGLADWMTLVEKLGRGEERASRGQAGAAAPHPIPGGPPSGRSLAKASDPAGAGGRLSGRRFVLTWAPHVKPLPMAVPHSALLSAAAAGMDVTLAHPPGYELNRDIVERAAQWCRASGAEFVQTDDQRGASREADALYVKSWGSAALYGDAAGQKDSFRAHRGWCVDLGHLGPKTILMHCLPVRRNVVVTDAALDDPRCVVVDQAENRLWTQAAVLSKVFGERSVRCTSKPV